MDKEISILGSTGIQNFIENYWQQKPLLVRAAARAYEDVLTADELAGLACEEEVESRLISSEDSKSWSVEDGPFLEERFAGLPENNWTLLVQAVDQWVPEVRAVLDEFSFLPSWRLDDVMISYASPGGGVGPHFDYYDVFLLQTRGKRLWKLGQHCDEQTALRPDQPLKLLEKFEQSDELELGPGDMLYIPAGLAHWGEGLDDECMTWSIGFRAPSISELMSSSAQLLAEQLPEQMRYMDSPESLKAQPGEISAASLEQLKIMRGLITDEMLLETMADALGKLSTEPRYAECVENDEWSKEEVDTLFQHSAVLVRNHSCRVAYRVADTDPEISRLYINGEFIEIPTEFAELIGANKADLASFESPIGRDLLRVLLFAGVYYVEG